MNPFNDGKLYEKVGKRYKPVASTCAYDGLYNGCWLIRIADGMTTTCMSVEPDNAAVEFAFNGAADKIVKILHKASEARFARGPIPLTKREIKAVKAYNDAMGGEKTLRFEYNSLSDIAREIVGQLGNQGPYE